LPPGRIPDEQIQHANQAAPCRARIDRLPDGRITLYAEAREVAGLIAAAPGGTGGAAPIETKHCCVVQYDADDIVTNVDVIRDKAGCTHDGVCFRLIFQWRDPEGWWYDKETGLGEAIVSSRRDDDAAAKTFAVDDEHRSVFVYETGDRGTLVVSRTGKPFMAMDNDSYLHWSPSPGPIAVWAASISGSTVLGDVSSILELDCAAGELYFLNISHAASWLRKSRLTLALDTPDDGERRVSMRRLVIE
jgi:hypothetical protein